MNRTSFVALAVMITIRHRQEHRKSRRRRSGAAARTMADHVSMAAAATAPMLHHLMEGVGDNVVRMNMKGGFGV